MSLGVFFILFTFLIVFNMPLSVAMILSTLAYIFSNGMDLSFIAMRMYTSLANFILLAIPFFLLTSEVMTRAGLSKRLFRFAQSLVGFVPGGLGHVNVLNSVIFSGMSGSAVADAGGIGRLSYEAMADHGYGKEFSMSVTAASAVIGPIIPPSLPMVVYAMVANESIGRLFFGGIGPGLILAFTLMVYVFVVSKRRGYPVNDRFNLRQIVRDFGKAFLPLLTPVILLGGIYFGVVTITEAAILAVLYAVVLGSAVYHSLTLRHFYESLCNVVTICGPILLLIVGATLFGFVLTIENVSVIVSEFITALSDNPYIVLLLINIIFLALGTMSDPLVNIMLFAPLFIPLVRMVGISTVHFGVVVVLNSMIGLITPPVGALLITVSGFGKVRFAGLLKEIWPLVLVELFVLIIITLFPWTVLAIPNMLFG